jgi:hypothetical protein
MVPVAGDLVMGSMPAAYPTLVLSRQKRVLGRDWSRAPSFLGGAPRLGAQPWPRNRGNGRAMRFLAQIDLAEIAEKIGPTELPSSGALAFFADEGAVVYVPDARTAPPAKPPHHMFPAYQPGQWFSDLAEQDDPTAPRLFPFWPLDFTLIKSPPPRRLWQEDEDIAAFDAIVAEVDRTFTRRQFNFGAKEAFATLGEAPPPYWWHSAMLFTRGLVDARDAHRRRLEQHDAGAGELPYDDFLRYLEDVSVWTGERDPWTRMQASDLERGTELFTRGRRAFRNLVGYRAVYDWQDLATHTLREMATADDRVYGQLPEPIRNLINEKFRLSIGANWHQMFGTGVSIQDNAAVEHEHDHLLLQLVYDDMMHWSFGDNGAFQYWISPENLAARRWDRAEMTFECH